MYHKTLQKFILYVLQPCDVRFSVTSQDIQESCQKTLQSFNLCMFYEPVIYSEDLRDENLHYLEDDIVFKVVVICMATSHILKKRGKCFSHSVCSLITVVLWNFIGKIRLSARHVQCLMLLDE